MNDIQKIMRDRYPGNTWADVARRDGELPEVLAKQSNPKQNLRDIPFARYTDPDFFELEMERMWKRVWQFACREEHVAEVGDYFVYDIGRMSVLIVRSESGLKAYYNSCLHRGTKLKASGSCGWSANITCPFHNWQWNLDGSLKAIPCDFEFPQVDRERAGLAEVQVASWNGMIFINFDSEAAPLVDYLEVLPEHFKNWDLTGWYVATHVRKHLPGNWKLSMEAFMEAYHTPYVHPEMTNVVGDHNMQHDIFSDHVSRDLCAMASPSPTSRQQMSQQDLLDTMLVGDGKMVGDRAKVPEGKTARWVMAQQLREQMQDQYGLDYSNHSVPEMIDSLKYHVFPNLLVYPAPGLCLVQQFRPDGHDRDRSTFDQYVLHPKPLDGDYEVAEVQVIGEHDSFTAVESMDAFLASVLDQDTDIMRWQREGMYASGKGAETLSIYQESRIRHLHDTLDKYLEGLK
ncbi:aromatic ring-hydroxylating oxygenase subunit alpha [Novosphingobium mathurense]|uniref:Phenylpropionate dioxygenase, large terminal subunit n=1 Tax=Novosphingobium mathurense TaxID=428990 RepID=A0A1U6I425_9SPHN|nr:aromatic ring-hydroxylating dioxygenase subunit alpha [Novosphingobium mathurense]SLK02769.1 Phenylpropionate dioxygenase, large terminal subunit [Novosphingobium mathurense]